MPSNTSERNEVVIKVEIVGDPKIGKTSLMCKFTEGDFDVFYDQTN
ncbi:30594_t:CDS:2, partial [Racocetra persica]